MNSSISFAKLALAMALAATPVAIFAKDKGEARPELFQKVIDCRAITDATARLACFDTQVANLDAAETRQDVVIVDKAQVKKAKRTLFGLTLPTLAIFGGKTDDKAATADQSDEAIETVIKSAYVNRLGKLTIIIDDDAKWVQIDTRVVNTPKPGQSIRIRRESLGSFFANINKQAAIRMRREN